MADSCKNDQPHTKSIENSLNRYDVVEGEISEYEKPVEQKTAVQQVFHQMKQLDTKSAQPKFLTGLGHGKVSSVSSFDRQELKNSPPTEGLVSSSKKSQGGRSTTYLDNMVFISERSIAQRQDPNYTKRSLQNFGVETVPVVCRSMNSRAGTISMVCEPDDYSDSCLDDCFSESEGQIS